MKLLVVIDEKSIATNAIRTAAILTERLNAELTVTTIRPGTFATENPPPIGVQIPATDRGNLPESIRTLLGAMDLLAGLGLLKQPSTIEIEDFPDGYLFFAEKVTGGQILFKERFGHLITELNQEIDENEHDLIIIAVQRGGTIERFAPSNLARRLALDLHSSFLVVRGGTLEEVKEAALCLKTIKDWLLRSGKKVGFSQLCGGNLHKTILDVAGKNSIIVMGESHKHDVERRTLGTLPMKVLAGTDSSFFMVKQPSMPDLEMFTAGEV